MPLSQEATALITKLEAVHERAFRGDREAVHFIKSLKTRALAGEVQSRRVYNTLAVIHWRKQKGGDYEKAEAYYKRLVAKEPQAMAKLQTLLSRVRQGDQEMLTLFRVLKSIHGKYKSSAFTDGPGAPKVGGYGLPQQHRPGIIIGNAGGIIDSLSPYGFQNVFGAMPPSHRPHIGHGGGFPMMPYRFHNPYGTRVSGLPSDTGFAIGAVEPLTPQAVANLIGLMVKVRAMPLGAAAAQLLGTFQQAFSAAAPPAPAPGGGTTQFTTTPAPSGFSTVASATKPMASLAAMVLAATPSGGATGAEMEAFKTANNTPQAQVTMGQLVCNNNPFMQAVKTASIGDDVEKLTGFYAAIVISLGNSLEGPGQNAARDAMLLPTISQNAGLNSRRLYGFQVGRDMMYKATLSKTPIKLPTTVKSLGRVGTPMTDAERAAMLANQGICNRAADALKRQSPAAPGLVTQCGATRRANILKGDYFADAMTPNDPAYRVALTDAGLAITAKNPQLKSFADSLMAKDPSGAMSRGFTMAMGVRNGRVDPAFPAFVRPGLSVDPNLIAGFDLGMSMQ